MHAPRASALYGFALGMILRDLADWAADHLGDHLNHRSHR